MQTDIENSLLIEKKNNSMCDFFNFIESKLLESSSRYYYISRYTIDILLRQEFLYIYTFFIENIFNWIK